MLASTSTYVFIIFVVDATTMCSWQDGVQSNLELNLRLPKFAAPITMESGTHLVQIVTRPSSTATEGKAFSQQPILNVTNLDGSPAVGVGCIATIVSKNGYYYPRGYAIGKNASTDKLLNGMLAADYDSTNVVSLNDEDMVVPRKTNASGLIEFSGLGFSSLGTLRDANATYGLMFKCGSAATTLNDNDTAVLVSTRVYSISTFYVSTYEVQMSMDKTYDILVSAFIFDSSGNGISGKDMSRVFVTIVPSSTSDRWSTRRDTRPTLLLPGK